MLVQRPAHTALAPEGIVYVLNADMKRLVIELFLVQIKSAQNAALK